MRERNIDWSYWLAMPEVRVWEAILLSLNIEPQSVTEHRNEWDRDEPHFLALSQPDANLPEEYEKRVQLLCANKHDRALFKPGTIRIDRPEECGVRLVEVGAWLVKLNRTPAVPEELAAAVLSEGGRCNETEEEGPSKKRGLGAHRTQEEDILETLRNLGYDPMAYPKMPSGEDGVRSQVRKILVPRKIQTDNVFKKAWERLGKKPEPRIKQAD